MNRSNVSQYIPGVVALIILFAGYFVAGAFTSPTANPPGSNVDVPLNVSSAGQEKVGGLILNTGGAINGLIVQSGRVGIGTLSPTELLHLFAGAQDATIRFGTEVAPGNTTVTFNYTGSSQTWTVPDGITSLTVDAKGASGGAGFDNNVSFSGGFGGRTQTTIPVSPGDILTIIVGGQGQDFVSSGQPDVPIPGVAGGYNGGGSGGSGPGAYYIWAGGGGGGGRTEVRKGNTLFVVAGGGGGGSGGPYNAPSGRGGAGGGSNGDNGFPDTCAYPSPCGGKGGLSGNNGGTPGAAGTGYPSGNPGSGVNGGNGVRGYNNGHPGGGGGGGYVSGGGGGAGGAAASGGGAGGGGGGGGGSSYSSGSSTTYTSGFQSGHGHVTLRWGAVSVSNWSMGADQSDAGKFKISNSSSVGSGSTYIFENDGLILPSGRKLTGVDPFPFGGMYSLLDNGNTCNQINPYTGSCSCPGGYTAINLGYSGQGGRYYYWCGKP